METGLSETSWRGTRLTGPAHPSDGKKHNHTYWIQRGHLRRTRSWPPMGPQRVRAAADYQRACPKARAGRAGDWGIPITVEPHVVG